MTLEQLRIFIAVAERQHMTRASEALALTQSAVSHAIMTLENGFGIKLFDRIGRVFCSRKQDGSFYRRHAPCRRARSLRANVWKISVGCARADCMCGPARHWRATGCQRGSIALRLSTEVTLGMTISNTEEICAQLAAGTIGFGLIEGVATGSFLETEILARDQLLLVVSPEHPWAQTPPEASALTETPWVLREKGPAHGRASKQLWQAGGSSLTASISSWS